MTLTSGLVLEKSCPEHISYIIKGRNPKFGGWMQLWMVECHIPFLGHFDLDPRPCLQNNRVQNISLILFEIGIPNLLYEYIFRC